MSRFIAVLLCFVVPATTLAGLPDNWKEIVENPKYEKSPTVAQTHRQFVAPASGYQIFPVADRFLFVFDPQGYPIVAFDTTMDPITMKDMFFGAIGIGSFSLRNIWKKYKETRERPEQILAETDLDSYQPVYDEIDQIERDTLPPSSVDDIRRGYDEFAKLEFTKDWMIRNGHAQALALGKSSGFKPASFTLGDLAMSEKQKKKLYPAMAEFSRLIFGERLQEQNLGDFLKQFQMTWNEEKKEFAISWSPSNAETIQAKQPKIPGWVLNYTNPLDILAYKYGLVNLDRQAMMLDTILGRYGSIVMVLVTRVTSGLRYRMESHENQLMALLEAAQRGQYKIPIPASNLDEFIEISAVMGYLNKVTNDDDITDGYAKRATLLANEAKYREQNLKWLAKKKYEVQIWPDERFATVFKNGKRKGVASLALKRAIITKHPSFHTYEGHAWFKSAHRVGLELLVAGIRMTVPQFFQIGGYLKSIPVFGYVSMPGYFWDIIFRSRAYAEISYEGHMIGFINEYLAGNWSKIPGYTREELVELRKDLYAQRVNPFEVPAKHESAAMKANQKLVKDLLGGTSFEVPAYVRLQ